MKSQNAIRITVAIIAVSSLGYMGAAQTSAIKKKQSSLSRSLSKVKSKRNELRSQLRHKKAAVGDMMDQVHAVDQQLNSLNARFNKTTDELRASKDQQAKLTQELEEQTRKLDAVKEKVAKRLRAMYVQGEVAPISILAESKSVSDLAARKALLQRIASRDRVLFTDVRILRDSVLSKKQQSDLNVARIAELVKKQQQEMKELQRVRNQKKQIFSKLKAEEDEIEEQLEEMLRESNRLEAQIAAIQARTSGTTPIFRGKFIAPISGRLTSRFGTRVHPITGKRKTHTGIDLAAPSGTTIKAAGGGKVITASYLRGYGNTVVIDHGGGISTLYGHCSRLYVRVGDTVKQGQKVAAVGSTGLSTGPHLHFEVRVNGKPVNPTGRY